MEQWGKSSTFFNDFLLKKHMLYLKSLEIIRFIAII